MCCVFITGNKRSWLRHGALPTKHLPQKSHPTVKSSKRRTIIKHSFEKVLSPCKIEVNESSTEERLVIPEREANTFLETLQVISDNLPSSWKPIFFDENEFHVVIPSEKYFVDDAKVVLYSNMTCRVALCGIPVPCESLPSMKLNAYGFCDFLKAVGQARLCCGLDKVLKPENWFCLKLFEINCTDLYQFCQR